MTSLLYVESDVPPGMTLVDWRAAKQPPKRRRRWPRFPSAPPRLRPA